MSYKIKPLTPDQKEDIVSKVCEFIKNHGCGEVIAQSDDANIEAPCLLADIADNIIGEKNIIYEE